ncbi:DNA-directed DNA polymerase I [Sulfodiicoccus acidiphilus]|nr:DNA-directed DNA polymerase I [Sulfodiicoccus acidiphilus]
MQKAKQGTLDDFLLTSLEQPRSEEESKEKARNQSPRPTKEKEGRNSTNREGLEMPAAEEGKSYLLLQVDYDGEQGKAFCKLYDVTTSKVHVLYDNTKHLPYFLADVPPDKISKIAKIVKDPSFERIELVEKVDPFTGRKVKLTKVVTKDPLAVRRMRDAIPVAYEAHIKYFNNYIYDLGLIPGMPYEVSKGQLKFAGKVPSRDDVDALLKSLEYTDEISKKTALDWFPIFETPIPTVKRVAIDIEVYTPTKGRVPNPKDAEFPIISIALAGSDGLKKVLVLERKDVAGFDGELKEIQVEFFKSERDLMMKFFEVLSQYPVVLTFNGDDFDIPYIFYRAVKLGIGDLTPFTVTKQEGKPATKYNLGLHVDLFRFFFNKAVRNYAFEARYSEYNLDAVASGILGANKMKLDTIVSFVDLKTLILYNYRDAEITLGLTTFSDELVWKLMILLARISKLGLEELTRVEVSTWIKNLYYWEHRQRGLLIPSKEEIARRGKIRTSAIIKGKGYKGAIVIDPPAGVFFNVVVLDFASLYPSVIKNWNISYETVDIAECRNEREVRDENGDVLHKVCMDKVGLTALITGLLRDFRVKIYKRKSKQKDLESSQKALYDVVQRAMKVFINATYGVFGDDKFPLYAPAVAESVTALGRFVITNTLRKAEQIGLRVLYGDTDSLFLHNPSKDKLEEIVAWVKKEFNLDFEVDKAYKLVLFSGLKKNYMGVSQDGKVEIKGMLAKKRNTPEFLKSSFNDVKSIVASMNSEADVEVAKQKVAEEIKEIYNKLREKGYNLDQLAFKVMLSKSIEQYTKTMPQHAKAALQLKRVTGQEMTSRDIILFVKVKGKEGVKPVQLAKLKEVDVEKYVEAVRSTFEQVLKALGLSWDDITSRISIDSFFTPQTPDPRQSLQSPR